MFRVVLVSLANVKNPKSSQKTTGFLIHLQKYTNLTQTVVKKLKVNVAFFTQTLLKHIHVHYAFMYVDVFLFSQKCELSLLAFFL